MRIHASETTKGYLSQSLDYEYILEENTAQVSRPN